MAVIEIPRVTQRRVLPQAGPVVQLDTTPPPVPGQAVGDALQVAGRVGAVVEADRQRKAEEDAMSAATLAFSGTRNKWNAELTKRAESAPLGAPGFTDQLLADFDQEAGALAKQPTKRSGAYMERQIGDLRAALQADAARFESQARTKRIVTEQGELLDENRTHVRAKPEDFDRTLAEYEAGLDGLGIPAETKDALRSAGRERLSAAAVESMVERDPVAALKALRADAGQSGMSAVEGLTPESRERAIGVAETEIRRREAEAKARQIEARQVLGDRLRDIATAASMGIDTGPTPSRAELVAAYGPEEGGQRHQQVQDMVRLSKDVAALHLMPTDELLAKVESYRPTQVEGAANQAQLYGAVAGPAQDVLAARQKDPAGYLVQYSPLVAERWQAFQEGAAPATAYLSALQAERERLGVLGHGVLPAGYVEAVAERVTKPQGDETLAATMAAEAERWGSAWPEVYKQLATEAKLPDVALVIGSGIPKRAADTLAGVAKLPPKEQEALIPAGKTRKDVQKEVADNLADLSSTFGPEGAPTLAAVQNSVEQLAIGYMAQGTSLGDAVEQAAKDVANDRYSFLDFRGHAYRVPADVDADLVDEGATRFLSAFRLPSGSIATPPGIVEEEVLGQGTDAIRRDGYWRTAPDESGLRLYYGGRPVPGPVQLTWAEAAALAADPTTSGRLRGVAPAMARPQPKPYEPVTGLIERR